MFLEQICILRLTMPLPTWVVKPYGMSSLPIQPESATGRAISPSINSEIT